MMVINLRNKILSALYAKKGGFTSGEDLSLSLDVSRTAIWKHINMLRKEGYEIEAINKKGYRLIETFNSLLPGELKPYIHTEVFGKNIVHFESLDSTNNYCKKHGQALSHGTIVVSEEQLLGRGRMGRDWSSPKGEGIWMSIFLKPEIPPSEGTKLTQIAAAAVCTAVRNTTGLEALIKWPNDILIHGKKLCGILTEMSTEINQIHYLVVGIGVNVNTQHFSKELSDMATSVVLETGEVFDRKVLAAQIINEFDMLYNHFMMEKTIINTIAICKKHSAILNKKVDIIRGDKIEVGLVEDITEDGNLLMLMDGGKKEIIQSGEVSIRGRQGYAT